MPKPRARTGADLAEEAKAFAEQHPSDKVSSLALASRLEGEAKQMKVYPTMGMRTANRLLVKRFDSGTS
jgi:hypothetical protein